MRPSHPRTPGLALLGAAALLLPLAAQAQQFRTGRIAETYTTLCASCHGANLQGGQAPSMLDDVWTHGGDDESLARSIRNGFPEKGMPAWSAALPETEIRAMVIYLREQRAKFQLDQVQFEKIADSMTLQSELHPFRLDTWVGGIREPWSVAFLPGTNLALVTEKRGRLLLVENGRLAAEPVSGLPAIDTAQQAGLYDVVPHPDYARNGWIYLAFSDLQNRDGKAVSLTRIIRGKLKDGAFVEQQNIFQGPLAVYPDAGRVHFGGRIAFDKAGHLYFTIGERGTEANAQNLAVPMGKIHRVHDDGRIPADNPFAKREGAMPSIWSYGHRNPQGLAIHPVTGQVFNAEHGPRGGDELNHVRAGRNYGWPVITYGMAYSGTAYPGSEGTAKEGLEQPEAYWVPSLAVCGINFYTGDLFPKWKNQLFLAALAAEEVRRIEIKDGKVVAQEVLFKKLGRVRHIIGGPDGALYVLLPDRISRMTPTP